MTQTVTKTGVSQALAYGVIASAAMAGFLFFWTSLTTSDKKLTSDQANVTSPATIEQLTTTLLQKHSDYRRQASPQQSDEVVRAAKQRSTQLKRLYVTDPDRASRVVVSEDLRKDMPVGSQEFVEREQTLSGTARERIAENPEAGTEETLHHLVAADGKTYRLRYANGAEPAKTGQQVEIATAYVLGDEALVSSATSTGAPNVTVTAEAVVTTGHKTAIILFNFQNRVQAPMTVDQVRQTVFTSSTSISNYFRETSSNRVDLVGKVRADGDIYGWVTIPTNEPATAADCNGVDTWASQANSLAAASGFTASGYDHYVYVMPWLSSQFSVCSWAGLADIGGTHSWINGAPNYVNIRVTGHELGHNFGLGHANATRCQDGSGQPVSMSTSCTLYGYGDPFDVMGVFPYPNRQFSAYRKSFLGWYESPSVVNVTTTGSYTLTPMEHSGAGTKVLRIQRPGAGGNFQYYYVEFRQSIGTFDNFAPTDPAINGVMIRLGPGSTSGGQTQLIDAVAATTTDGSGANGFLDAALPVGQTFQDFQKGIRITTELVSLNTASVNVEFTTPICQHTAPVVNFLPPTQNAAAGSSKVFTFDLVSTEDSTCPSATYSLVGSLPAGWSQTVTPSTLTLVPGQSARFTVTVTSPSNALIGNYTLTENAINAEYPANSVSKQAGLSIIESESIPPVVTISSPVDGSRLPSKGKVNVTATATDTSGIAKIDIKIDNLYVKSCTNVTSCTYSWNLAKGVAAGTHTITAIVSDKSPAANQSVKTITVTK